MRINDLFRHSQEEGGKKTKTESARSNKTKTSKVMSEQGFSLNEFHSPLLNPPYIKCGHCFADCMISN